MRETLERMSVQILHGGGERVTGALELSQVEQCRPPLGAGRHRNARTDVWEALRDDLRMLPLQARDLRPQRGPRGSLVRLPKLDGGASIVHAPAGGKTEAPRGRDPRGRTVALDD
jgi:hypothetical protein